MNTAIISAALPSRVMTPEELALQSLCKTLFKSRLFRGFYDQRCYVDELGSYRDIVILQRTEREFEKLLVDTKARLQVFYHRIVPNMWVGITKGSYGCYKHLANSALLDTCLWVELTDVAIGEYWFSIKSIRFRDQEVLFKLKMVRPVEMESSTATNPISRNRLSAVCAIADNTASLNAAGTSSSLPSTLVQADESHSSFSTSQPKIEMTDFVTVFQQWGDGIKRTAYEFMANDINKDNIIGTLRFLGMLTISILTGAIYGVRFLGLFTLRFLFEFSRFTHVATPIIFKIIETFNKIVGGIFILFTMIWKDLVMNRGNKQPNLPALQYDELAPHYPLKIESGDSATRNRRSMPLYTNRYAPDLDASSQECN